MLGLGLRLSNPAGVGPSSPVNSVAPSFTGTLTAGQTLTYVPGAWSGSPTVTKQWFSNGVAIGGAIGNTLDSTGYGGTEISVGETATNSVGSATAASLGKYLFVNDVARILVARINVEPATFWKAGYDAAYSVSGFATALAKHDQMWVAGPDKQSSLLDWCASRSLGEVGTLNYAQYFGLSGNGVNTGMTAGFAPNSSSKFLQNDAAIWVSLKSSTGSNSNYLIGSADGSELLRINESGGGSTYRVNETTSISGGANGSNGFFLAQRTGATALELRKDGVQVATSAQASSSRTSAAFEYLRSTAAGAFPSAGTILRAGGISSSLSGADETAIIAGLTAFFAVTQPKQFLVVAAGQSLMTLQFLDDGAQDNGSGDGTVGSNVINSIFKPQLQAFLNAQYTTAAPVLTVLDTSKSGSALNKSTGLSAPNTWWDDVTVPNGPLDLAVAFNTAVSHRISSNAAAGFPYDAIVILWNHGQAEVQAAAGSPVGYVKGFCAAAHNAGLQGYMHTVCGAIPTTIVITPLGFDTDYADADIKAVRDAQTEIAANVANTLLGNEESDLDIFSGEWHPKPRALSATGFARMAALQAKEVAFALGCTTVKYKGPDVVSAAIVDATHTDITINYSSDCGGTDFTPTSAISGFVIFDAGVSKAISAAVRTGATTIRLTHASIAGARTVQYIPPRIENTRTSLVRDNYDIGIPMRMSALLTAT